MRHFKVRHTWKRSCTSDEYAMEENTYSLAEVIPQEVQLPLRYNYYMTSTLKRAQQTLRYLIGETPFEITSLLDEVPLAPFITTQFRLSIYLWLIMGRIQWFLNIRRQPETRIDTIARSKALITKIGTTNKNYLIVVHGFFLRILANQMIESGYSGKRISYMYNGEHSTYYKD